MEFGEGVVCPWRADRPLLTYHYLPYTVWVFVSLKSVSLSNNWSCLLYVVSSCLSSLFSQQKTTHTILKIIENPDKSIWAAY